MVPIQRIDWQVLLIGGPSGVGKTVVAQHIGLHYGIPWMQIDDLRLALTRSQVTLPEHNEALYFFEAPEAWQQSSEQFCNALIELGQVMSPAIEIVVENHVDTHAPIIIEGDAIQPAFFTRSIMRNLRTRGLVRVVFLVEPDEKTLLKNMQARGRGIEENAEHEQIMEAHAKWLYGRWLAEEARQQQLAVLEPRPWPTLVERIIAAI
ncbi:MAG TPA: hypothetical protein VHZ51_06710 [Ktedonobacteraceae bacterium]|jgi:2-phosphoglycerate kinase|nr:hypothetical protein [Ktedonobacteraceae bacterium]